MQSQILTKGRSQDPDIGVRSRQPVSPALISLVIPCYNQARFLSDAIESVLAQTWKKVELIVVDDGSTDNTSLIAQQFSAVRYLHQVNRGLSVARNAGLAWSTGQYVAFLDADDRLLPDALKQAAEYLLAHPDCAFVHGDYRHIAIDGSSLSTVQRSATRKSGYIGLLQGNYIGMHGAVLYSREILESVGGFDSSLPACEDYELYLRIARTHPFGYHHHLVAEYRRHGQNLSSNTTLMLRTSLSVLRSQRSLLTGDKELEEAFRTGQAFWWTWYGVILFKHVYRGLRASELGKNTLDNLKVLFECYPDYSGASYRVLRHLAPLAGRKMSVIGKSVFGRWIRNRLRRIFVGSVRFGNVRRLSPVSRNFGFEHGTPVDRYYIEGFLSRHSDDIRGRVLEIADNSYTRKFGGTRVTQSVVVNLLEQSGTSIAADLTRADHIASGTFDCIILTQTLHLIYDFRSALRTIHRILKPGGVVLVTVPGISQICRDGQGTWSDFWRFTDASLARLLQEVFPPAFVRVDVYGNVLSATAFLQGLVVADLKESEMDHRDPDYQVIIAARAQKDEDYRSSQ